MATEMLRAKKIRFLKLSMSMFESLAGLSVKKCRELTQWFQNRYFSKAKMPFKVFTVFFLKL